MTICSFVIFIVSILARAPLVDSQMQLGAKSASAATPSLRSQKVLVDAPSLTDLQAQLNVSSSIQYLRGQRVVVDLPSISDQREQFGAKLVSAPIPSMLGQRLFVDLPSNWRVVALSKSGHGSYALVVRKRGQPGNSAGVRRIDINVFQRMGLFVGSFRGLKCINVAGAVGYEERVADGPSSFEYFYTAMPTRKSPSAWLDVRISSHGGRTGDQESFARYVFQHIHFAK